mmetsp:Transcript_26840/g.86169  ORF Transcript_26840/g.86169 Transcript_26840/m.86169 type:complete len:205 (-) Transcript_26840:23-637(-)
MFPGTVMLLCFYVSSLCQEKRMFRANTFDRHLQVLVPSSYFICIASVFVQRYTDGWIMVVLAVVLALIAVFVLIMVMHRQRLVTMFNTSKTGILTADEKRSRTNEDISVVTTMKDVKDAVAGSMHLIRTKSGNVVQQARPSWMNDGMMTIRKKDVPVTPFDDGGSRASEAGASAGGSGGANKGPVAESGAESYGGGAGPSRAWP